jgi:hypothetical protein
MSPYYQGQKESSERTERDMKQKEWKQVELQSNANHNFEQFGE